ncbi:MAG: excinuclease ABC subunit UvrB, partial [Candidatus Pacebacteria bacterium]|nr:excinuclease ABC subunit UvrB [Candidatus Paceibacterota bacterium]
FVSYYDYYQPEAYMSATDTFIEKDMSINVEIERLRHASTQVLLSRKDVIIVASVSCIYGLGSPEEYLKQNLKLAVGDRMDRREFMEKLIKIYFERTTADLQSGKFRVTGSRFEIMSTAEKVIYLVELTGNTISAITKVDAMTREILGSLSDVFIFPAKHYVTDEQQQKRAVKLIKAELDLMLNKLEKEGKMLERERLKRRTNYDLALIKEVGFCSGIENYSRHFEGREAGTPSQTLLSYFPHKKDGTPDFLTIIDESHITVPQLNGMYAGDASRKKNLIEYGFRLPSALDNRPLRFEEFKERVGQVLFTSATPGDYEKENSGQIVRQVIRPTGLLDPVIDIRPVIEKGKFQGQIKDLIQEIEKTTKKGERTLVTTLTKKMAEDLSEFLKEKGIKTEYLHSDVKTIDRIQILSEFRKGVYDCLVGVNLLREGLDLPEVSLVGILDADKEGFLRSETSLIQTMGRAARNENGRVILYADRITGSIEKAVRETRKRRESQIKYNKENDITPKTISKTIHDITEQLETKHSKAVNTALSIDKELIKKDPQKIDRLLKQKNKQMNAAAKILDFETAALLRDEILELEKIAKDATIDTQ